MGANFQDVIRDVHDPSQHALKTTASLSASTVYIGNATLFAVVNTAAAGQASVVIDAGTKQIGSVTVSNPITLNSVVTLSPSINSIGFATVQVVNLARTITGNLTLTDPKTYIGLVTATLDNSRGVGVVGNVTLTDPKTYIGAVTATIDPNPVLGTGALQAVFISTASGNSLNVNLRSTSGTPVSFVADNSDAVATSVVGRQISVLNKNSVFNGSTWDRMAGNVSGVFIKNAGSNKTLIPLPIAVSTTSVTTIAVPTGGNAIFYATQLLLNANATTGVSIKSGATYLTGNASLRVNLNPGGGWVENGSPDSPVYIGLASGAALVVEKNDVTTTVTGKVIYYQE